MEPQTRMLAAVVARHISFKLDEIKAIAKALPSSAVSLVVLNSAYSGGLVTNIGKGLIRPVDVVTTDLPNHRATLDAYAPPPNTVLILVTVAVAGQAHCAVVTCGVER